MIKHPRGMNAENRRRIRLERTYQAPIEDVWELWTTKEGIESWWGPGGFRVVVKRIDVRPGGKLEYVMEAVDPEQIAFMKQSGMPTAHDATLTYTEVVAPTRLAYVHAADFIPGVEVYDVSHLIEIAETANGVRMTLTFDAMHDEHWTTMAKAGWEEELDKLGRALEA